MTNNAVGPYGYPFSSWQVSVVKNNGPSDLEVTFRMENGEREIVILKVGQTATGKLKGIYFGKGMRVHYEVKPQNEDRI